MTQTYANHVRLDPKFGIGTLFLIPGLIMLIVRLIRNASSVDTQLLVALLFVCVGLIVFWTVWRGYPLVVQDRLIRLEETLRYQRLGITLDSRLTLKQMIALRFASDDELADLMTRACEQSLTPKAIKQAITHWKPDTLRV